MAFEAQAEQRVIPPGLERACGRDEVLPAGAQEDFGHGRVGRNRAEAEGESGCGESQVPLDLGAVPLVILKAC